jgi:hypothetical protein
MIPNASPSALDRILLYLRQLIRAEFPRLTFLGIYEYAVQSVLSGGAAYAISPTDPSISLPGSNNVPLRLSCATATLAAGSLVLIMFVNGDPSRPFIVSGAPTPTNQTIDALTQLNLGPSAASVVLAGGGDTVVLGSKLAIELANIATSIGSIVYTAGAVHPTPYVPGNPTSAKVTSG